jgi:transcriptional regulator with XRE-family HTH domain
MTSKELEKFSDTEYRKAFVASQINIGIPFQIRGLMKAHGWTQEKLAERADMAQPRISAMLKPGKVRPNIETLRRLASAFDCGLLVRFAPYGELVKWSDQFDPDNFRVPSFQDDPAFKGETEETKLAAIAGSLPKGGALQRMARGELKQEDLTWLGNSIEVASQIAASVRATQERAVAAIREMQQSPPFTGLQPPETLNVFASDSTAVDDTVGVMRSENTGMSPRGQSGLYLIVNNDVRKPAAVALNPDSVKKYSAVAR